MSETSVPRLVSRGGRLPITSGSNSKWLMPETLGADVGPANRLRSSLWMQARNPCVFLHAPEPGREAGDPQRFDNGSGFGHLRSI